MALLQLSASFSGMSCRKGPFLPLCWMPGHDAQVSTKTIASNEYAFLLAAEQDEKGPFLPLMDARLVKLIAGHFTELFGNKDNQAKHETYVR